MNKITREQFLAMASAVPKAPALLGAEKRMNELAAEFDEFDRRLRAALFERHRGGRAGAVGGEELAVLQADLRVAEARLSAAEARRQTAAAQPGEAQVAPGGIDDLRAAVEIAREAYAAARRDAEQPARSTSRAKYLPGDLEWIKASDKSFDFKTIKGLADAVSKADMELRAAAKARSGSRTTANESAVAQAQDDLARARSELEWAVRISSAATACLGDAESDDLFICYLSLRKDLGEARVQRTRDDLRQLRAAHAAAVAGALAGLRLTAEKSIMKAISELELSISNLNGYRVVMSEFDAAVQPISLAPLQLYSAAAQWEWLPK